MCIGLAYFILNQNIKNRQGISFSSGLYEIVIFIYQRWIFYAQHLTANLRIIILISTLYLSIKTFIIVKSNSFYSNSYFILTLCIIVSLILKQFPSIALLTIFVASFPILKKRKKISLAIIWFALPLFGYMTISFINRTYLVESSFGAAIIIGFAINEFLINNHNNLKIYPKHLKTIILSILIVISCLTLSMFAYKFREKINALNILSANRLNMRDMINYISINLNEKNTYISVIDYKDMEISSYLDIRPLDDLEKAQRQKVFGKAGIQMLLQVADKHNIKVKNFTWFVKNKTVKNKYLLVMNNYEIKFLDSVGLNLKKEIIYRAKRSGEKIWLIKSNNAAYNKLH